LDAWQVELLLYLIGVLLLFIEIFIPSGGSLAIAAILCIAYSVYSLFERGQPIPAWTLLALTLGYCGLLVRFWLKRMRLDETLGQSDGNDEDVNQAKEMIGQTGVALTALRPTGIAKIDGHRYDVMTMGSFIDPGNEIRVIEASGNRILVRPQEASESDRSPEAPR